MVCSVSSHWKAHFVLHAGCQWVTLGCSFCGQQSLLLVLFDFVDLFTLAAVSRWKSFKRQMLNVRAHSDSKGIEIKRPSDSLYSVPCPDCMRRSNKTEVLKSSLATWFWEYIRWCFSSHCLYGFKLLTLPFYVHTHPPPHPTPPTLEKAPYWILEQALLRDFLQLLVNFWFSGYQLEWHCTW